MKIETETLDKLYLEIAQFTTAKSCKEIALEKEISTLKSLLNDGHLLLRTQWNILLPVIEETFTHKANLNTVKLERDEALVERDSLKSQLSAAEKARDDYATEIYRLAEELRIRISERPQSDDHSIGPHQ